MNLNLDSLKEEIQHYLDEEGFVAFHGYASPLEPTKEAHWDVTRYSDFRPFLRVAQEAGVRIIVFHCSQFASDAVDEAVEQLGSVDLPRDEVRRFERHLRQLREYEGFTHEIELSFDHGGRTYIFELRTEWYAAFQDLLDELDMALPDDDEDDDQGPMDSGFFSNN